MQAEQTDLLAVPPDMDEAGREKVAHGLRHLARFLLPSTPWRSAAASWALPLSTRLGKSRSSSAWPMTTTRAYASPPDMLSNLTDDNRHLGPKLHGQCEAIKGMATSSLLEIYLDQAERRTWLVYEATRPVD